MPPPATHFYNKKESVALPLLQPPLNKLFIPRPTLPHVPPIDKELDRRSEPCIGSTFEFIGELLMSSTFLEDENDTKGSLFSAPFSSLITLPSEIRKKMRSEKKQRSRQAALDKVRSKYHPEDAHGEGLTVDPYKTIFVSRLPYSMTEDKLATLFKSFGTVRTAKLVYDNTRAVEKPRPRGYGFVEFSTERAAELAFRDADAMKVDGKRIVVDVERGRTVHGWLPRRLGGGLGGKTRDRHFNATSVASGRDSAATLHSRNIGRMVKRQRQPQQGSAAQQLSATAVNGGDLEPGEVLPQDLEAESLTNGNVSRGRRRSSSESRSGHYPHQHHQREAPPPHPYYQRRRQ